MNLTQEILKSLLHYDPETGVFTRLVSKSNAHRPGIISGGRTDQGYIRFQVCGVSYKAHRLAWFYMTGKWPKNQIDHRNTVRDDNRFENLREATNTVNHQNFRRAKSDNSLGLLGVSRNKNRFMARIVVNGETRHIGTYDTPEIAHDAYIVAKRQFHEGCTI